MAKQLKNLELEEVSLVGKGANQGAHIVVVKNDDTISKDETLLEKIASLLNTKKEERTMPTNEEIAKEIEKTTKGLTEITEAVAKLSKTIEPLVQKVGDLEDISKLSPDEQKYCSGMSAEDRKKFMGMKPDERAAAMKKEDKKDDVNKGDVITKADLEKSVSEAVEKATKEKDTEIQKLSKTLSDEQELRKNAERISRVEKEFSYVQGTVQEKADLLKSFDEMPEAARKAAYDNLAKSNEAFKLLTKANGHNHTNNGDAQVKLDKMAADYAKEHKVSKAVAYTRVVKTEDGAKLLAEHSAANRPTSH